MPDSGKGDSRNSIFYVLIIVALSAAYLAYSAPSAPSAIWFTQNSSANYANSSFSINWTPNDISESVSNYTVYVFNSSSFVLSATNTSASGYFFSAAVNNGNYTFNISATNTSGFAGPNSSASTWVYMDTEKPAISLMSPANESLNDSSTIFFRFNATDNSPAALNCSVNVDGAISGINSSVANNTATELAVAVSAGTHIWNVSCNDAALNFNTSFTRTLYLNLAAPSITLNSPAGGAWQNPDNNVNFNYTPSDDFGLKNCSLYLTNAANQNFAYNRTNSSALVNGSSANSFTLNFSTASQSNYTWNVQCFDTGNKSAFASSNATFFVGKNSDLIISAISVSDSSNNASRTNPIAGGYITANVTVQNTGTVMAVLPNVSFYWDGALIGTNPMSSIDIGSTAYTIFNVSAGNVSASKPYNATAIADPSNGIMETNESNNAFSKTILTGLNITLLSITPLKPSEGQQLRVNLSVSYSNGTPITIFAKENITSLFDVYGSVAKNINTTLSNFNSSNNATGNYWFNITAAAKNATTNRAEAGNHTLRIFAVYNSTGAYYDNMWAINGAINDTSKYYGLQAPNLEIRFNPAVTYSIDTAYNTFTKAFTMQIKNNGTTNISGINITVATDGAASLTNNSVNYSTSVSCNLTSITISDTFATIPNCNIIFNTTASNTYNLTAIAGGIDSGNAAHNSTRVLQQITVANSSGGSTASSSGSGTGSDVYAYGINFTNYSKILLIEQGGNATALFSIKNSGNGTVNNITLSLALPEKVSWGNWYNATKISELYSGATSDITASMSIPQNATIAAYTITAKAAGTQAGTSKTTAFTIQVTPGAATKKTINITLSDIDAQIAELNATLLQLIGNGENANLTIAYKKLAEAARLRLEAEQAIAKGDYLAAFNAKNDIEALLPEIKEIISSEQAVKESADKTRENIYIGAIILIAIAAALYYLWLPEEGYVPGKGYTFKAKGDSVFGRLNDEIAKHLESFGSAAIQAVQRISGKNDNNQRIMPEKAQPYSYTSRNDSNPALQKMATNILEQFKEHGEAGGKPVYNYHKKQRWSND